jgi:pimeloyl-ACP methyl ester carboxylesterase
MPTAIINNIQIYYESHGAGEPLVLIPGFASGVWIWFKQIEELAKSFRVITFDPRGVSRSDKPQAAITIKTIADDVAALLEQLNIEQAHILGASFGGFVAQEFVLAYPQKVKSLILCCTSFGGAKHIPPSMEVLTAFASTKGLNTEERVRENLLLAFNRTYVETHKEEIDKVCELRATNVVPEYVYTQQLQAAVMFDASERVSQIQTPTLVLTGDNDSIVPPQNSRNLAALIPNAELKFINGGSHLFFIEQAEEFNQTVRESVVRCPSSVAKELLKNKFLFSNARTQIKCGDKP